MQNDEKIEILNNLLEDSKNLKTQDSSSSEFKTWGHKVKRGLSKIFGENSFEYKTFSDLKFYYSPGIIVGGVDYSSYDRESFINAYEVTMNNLADYKKEFEKEKLKIVKKNKKTNNKVFDNRVFIVHGHNNEAKDSLSNFLRKIKLDPIILHEQISGGLTIIEKLEKYSEVEGAIALFTADDMGKSKKEEELKNRARQNVVFEAGMFLGKLGRNRLIILKEKGVSDISDLDGILYIDIDSNNSWHFQVAKELKAMGYKQIDLNDVLT